MALKDVVSGRGGGGSGLDLGILEGISYLYDSTDRKAFYHLLPFLFKLGEGGRLGEKSLWENAAGILLQDNNSTQITPHLSAKIPLDNWRAPQHKPTQLSVPA